MNKQTILTHYLFAALWTAELDSRDIDEIALASKENAIKDIDSFVEKAGTLLDGMNEEQVGHDFWLTRNGHGAGFWDRGLGEVGKKLTEICKEFKELNVFGDEPEIIIE